MGTHRLVAHPDRPPAAVQTVAVQWSAGAPELHLRYRVEGTRSLVVPPFAGAGRGDELWQTTCFELFVRAERPAGYLEFNFSPSGRWAAYRFDSYRSGMRDLPLIHEPRCELRMEEQAALLEVRLPAAALPPPPWSVGLSAILEEDGGALSYWALAHPAGKPDFHHPACFALAVPPPGAF